MQNTYSIQVRVQRITLEDGYVSVPVDDAVLGQPEQDGMRRLDGAKVLAAAVAIATQSNLPMWTPEGKPEISVHPVQMARPDGEKSD